MFPEVPNTDHVAEGKALLLEEFKRGPVLNGLLTAFLKAIQTCEGIFSEILYERFLDNATGVQLDTLGTIVGQLRGASPTDESYRARIKLRIRVNRSTGRAEDILEILRLAATGNLYYLDLGNAKFEIGADYMEDIYALLDLFADAKAVGTSAILTLGTSRWSHTSGTSGSVWGHTSGTSGAEWGHVALI